MFASVQPARCLLVGLEGRYRAHAEAAAAREFPEASVTASMTLPGASQQQLAAGLELLVLANPSRSDLEQAAGARDAHQLPRWAIVVLGKSDSMETAEFVCDEEWNEPLLTRVFRSVMARHHLRRKNARLSGDLQTLATRIMHDLRTPLGGILAAGEALKEVVAEHAPAEATLANSLFDSVDDMKRLTQRVSMVVKASLHPAPKAAVPMGDVVLRVIQGSERLILRKSAVIVQPEAWPEVSGVATWLETIWSNLLLNALQHGQGEPRVELGWSQGTHQIRFWVLTPHHRVPQEKLPHLFQAFHLLHQSNAAAGLGLSIVQRLVELQGGTCGHEFYSNAGSLFYFTLPSLSDGSTSQPTPPLTVSTSH